MAAMGRVFRNTRNALLVEVTISHFKFPYKDMLSFTAKQFFVYTIYLFISNCIESIMSVIQL